MQIANHIPVESEILQSRGGDWYTFKTKYAKRQVVMADKGLRKDAF